MAAKNEKLIVGLDVGSSKVCVIIGEVGRDNHIKIIGVGQSASRGLSRGVVVNIEETTLAIASAIEQAERQANLKIGSAFVGVAGAHISSINSRGVVAVSRVDRDITHEDVGRAIESARSVAIPSQRGVLHVIPRTFVIDGQDGVRDPVGMSGYRLEVETHIVTGGVSSLNNLFKAVQRVGIEVDELVLEPLAASEAVLSDAEKRLGVALVDIGAGTTDIAIYMDGTIWHTAVLPVGGSHFTNDIAIVLRTPPEVAERLKLKYGDASLVGPNKGYYADYYRPGGIGAKLNRTEPEQTEATERPDEMIMVESFEGQPTQQVSRNMVNEIIHSRAKQLFEMVQGEIKKSGYDGMIPAGLVFTGGTAGMTGLSDAAAHVLRMPVRVGVPRGLSGLSDSLGAPTYAASVGLVLWGLKKTLGDELLLESRRGGGGLTLGRKVGGWFRNFLP
ncbi:MAG: cell division protein FtsA [Chloroflexota bacterium]